MPTPKFIWQDSEYVKKVNEARKIGMAKTEYRLKMSAIVKNIWEKRKVA